MTSLTAGVSASTSGTKATGAFPNLEDQIVQQALSSGIDLRDYSHQIDEKLKKAEHEAIQDYIREAENIASLHNQIQGCDNILENMETMLSGFQKHLGSISSEITNLQAQSIVMGQKLKNRQSVRGELSQFVDEMSVSEAMINNIMDVPVAEREFLEQLHELQHKISFLKDQKFRCAKSVDDVEQILDKLKEKALTKIREFLLAKIYQFRKPLSNYQVPQNSLLTFRFYYEFVLRNERHMAKEVQDEYVDTVGKMYWSYFKTYTGRLLKLLFDDIASKDDLLGVEDAPKTSIFSGRTNARSRAQVFSLGSRDQVLTSDLQSPVIVPHAAHGENKKYPFEQLFRSVQFSLVDNACREFLFLGDFFMVQNDRAHQLFNQVMGKTLEVISKTVTSMIDNSYDGISLLLCVHLVQRYKILMLKRNVDALDPYWDNMLEVHLMPRFKYVLQINIDSVRDVDPEKLTSVDMRPHYIVRRYAEFSAAILSINENFPDERVTQLMGILQHEVDGLILRLAHEMKDKKEQLICLINNYDMMLVVIKERTNDVSVESQAFDEHLILRRQEYIDLVLNPHFGALIKFVREAEGLIQQKQSSLLMKYVDKVPKIIAHFNSEWMQALKNINSEIMKSFSNFKNGTTILQTTLTEVVQYYDRFVKILRDPAFHSSNQQNLLNVHHLMVEVKKYKTQF